MTLGFSQSKKHRQHIICLMTCVFAFMQPSQAQTVDQSLFSALDSDYVASAQAMQNMEREGVFPPLTLAHLATHRSRMFGKKPSDEVAFETIVIPASDKAPAVKVYIINKDVNRLQPAILHTHGGGFVIGSAESDIGHLQDLAQALDCTIVTVEYSLAPEASYRTSLEENYSALRWIYNNAASLGIQRKQIALLGESAGGGHAALLAITARDRAEVPVLFQALIYPMLDDRTGAATDNLHNKHYFLWDQTKNQFGWQSFLGQQPGTDDVPIAAVPARTLSLAGLPPTFIGVGALDLFVEEDIEYAKRLITAGVPTELVVIPGVFHGFDVINPQAKAAQRFSQAKINALKKAFALSSSLTK